MNVIWLFWILVVLNIADLGLTSEIINRGGAEANPYVDYFIQQFGMIPGIIIAKAPWLIFLGYVLHKWKEAASTQFVKYSMLALNLLYFGVVAVSGTLLVIYH